MKGTIYKYNLNYCISCVSNWFLILITIIVCSEDIFGQVIIKFNREVEETSENDIPTFDEVGWIYYYLTGYYSRWEAEKNQTNLSGIGVKHIYGDTATWKDVKCWSTKGISSPRDSVMYGPHYQQDKKYNRWFESYHQYALRYVPRFRMAIDNPGNAERNEEVCELKVVFSYKDQNTGILHDTTFLKKTLKVEDFDTSGNFKYFYISDNPCLSWYNYYPESYIQYPPQPPLNYIDWEAHTGIQFCVDWLMKDTLCTLYLDFVEVYDRDGWDNYLNFPEMTIDNIKHYISDYMDWKYIPFLSSQIKITTIDNYFPVSIIDSLFISAGAPSLLPEDEKYHLTTSPGSEKPDMWIQKDQSLKFLKPIPKYGFDEE